MKEKNSLFEKIFLLVLMLVPLLVSCGTGHVKDKRVITVTIEPLRFFTEQIAGDRFSVVTMVPKGGNPETYEPSAQQMMDLSQSDLYIKVGNIGFERTWMKKLEANAPHAIIVDSSDGIVPQRTPHGDIDPHTWMSTANARIMAQNIYRALAGIDTKDSLYFRDNLEALLAKIDAVDTAVRENLTKDKAQAFLVYHPVLTYFAHDYKLRQIAMEEEGREPSAAQLKGIISEARACGVRTFFVQKEFANRNVDVVARATSAAKTPINPLGYDWVHEMTNVAKMLR